MKEYKIDVPVMLLFFTRQDTLSKVFDSVREAKPRELFLFQDGPRDENDMGKILECRKIVENIDWDCIVYKHYCEENLGCDKSQAAAFEWAFEKVDRLIFLEDDCVPAQSFYPFCECLLEKYKNDHRVHMICGMNHVGDYTDKIAEDYLFAKTPTIWGWATWKRSWELWDTDFSYLEDETMKQRIRENVYPKRWAKFQIQRAERTREEFRRTGKVHSFELLNAMAMHLQSSYAIIPAKNMISNVGISEGSVHNVAEIKYVPMGMRRLFNMKLHEMDISNMKHPKYVVDNKQYHKELFDIMGRNNRLKTFWWRIESYLRRVFLK